VLGEGSGGVKGEGDQHVDGEIAPGAAGFHETQGIALGWAGLEEFLSGLCCEERRKGSEYMG
jgi:hypothetical protein